MTPHTGNRYPTLSIAMHWLMFVLLVVVYALIELREIYPKGSEPRELMKTLHYMFGMLVFFLVWLRIVLHLFAKAPPILPPPAAWQQWAAKGMHVLLYAFMIIMPLLGWLYLSARGKTTPFFGLELPPLMAKRPDMAEWFEETHEWLGVAGYYLVGLHTVAALFHHHVMHDDTLLRMLPRRG